MTDAMLEYLRWNEEVSRVELRLARHLHDDEPEPDRPCQDELARAYARMALLWDGFSADEKDRVFAAIEERLDRPQA